MKNIKCAMLVYIACLLISPASQSASEFVSGQISRFMLDEVYYGKCMINVKHSASIDCPQQWVSFDCEGNYLKKSDAARMWDTATLAYALGKSVEIRLDDTRKNNGYCIATRLNINE